MVESGVIHYGTPITDSPIFSTVTYSADQKQSAQVGQSAWPLQVPRFSEASIPSVGWHLIAIKRAHARFLAFLNTVTSTVGVSDLGPSVVAPSVISPFPVARPSQAPRQTDGKKGHPLLLDYTKSLPYPLSLTSPFFSTPSSRSSSGSHPSHMLQAHAPALAVPWLIFTSSRIRRSRPS